MASESKIGQINRYPYLLWLNYFKPLEVDLENNTIRSDIKESRISPESPIKIVLLKYVPLLIILFLGTYPSTLQQLAVFGIAAAYLAVGIFLYRADAKYAKYYVVMTSLVAYLLLFKVDGISYYLNYFIAYLVEIYIGLMLMHDIVSKRYKGYYRLDDIVAEKDVVLASHKRRVVVPIPFTGNRKGIKAKTGLNLRFNLKLGGYFVRFEE